MRPYLLLGGTIAVLLCVYLLAPRPSVPPREVLFYAFDHSIYGSYLVKMDAVRRETWKPLLRYPCDDHDTFLVEDDFCSVGGLEGQLTVGFSGHNHLNQRVDVYEFEQLMKKPYRAGDDFRVEYVTLWVRCDFPVRPPALPLQVLGRTFQVDHSRPRPLREGSVGICARAPFGEGVDVPLFVNFYRQMWSVEDIIVYDVGLADSPAHDDTVNLFPLLRRLYGSLAHDVLYLSWAMGQNWLRTDCELRMRKRGIDWVFAPDFDELLFPPRRGQFAPLHTYLQKFPTHDWLSVGSLLSDREVPCGVRSYASFARQEQAVHLEEWRNSSAEGPFECNRQYYDTRVCPSYRGRRKLFVRDRGERAFGMIEIHQLWSCAYGREPSKVFGEDLNAEFQPYIRHYRSLNNHNCNNAG